MKRKTAILVLLHFLFITNLVGGKIKKTKSTKVISHGVKHEKSERPKRSLDDEDDKPFWANRGKKFSEENKIDYDFTRDPSLRSIDMKLNDDIIKEPPFWGNRGRRYDSSSSVSSKSNLISTNTKLNPSDYTEGKTCQYACLNPFHTLLKINEIISNSKLKHRREEDSPFWGTRGRRNSEEIIDDDVDNDIGPFWGNRGRRQDEDSPFWGNRGRREDETPFWGTRGRRDDIISPFWGTQSRREEDEPFWGNRGRREDDTPFWGNRGRRKFENIKQAIVDSINNEVNDLSRLRRSSIDPLLMFGTKTSFWGNRGRDSKLKDIFNLKHQSYKQNINSMGKYSNLQHSKTLYDDKMYVEEPHFILVDRSGRSSSIEDDPFYVSRGKKKNKLKFKTARGRRGVLEDIVKTVKTDPYFIARGKKDQNAAEEVNATNETDKILKTKDLICSATELLNLKKVGTKVKRETVDNERERRTILKKLAAQLQVDPYFVSRGKKSSESMSEDDVEEFVSQMSAMCN